MDWFISELPAKLMPLVTSKLHLVKSDVWHSATFWACVFWVLWSVRLRILVLVFDGASPANNLPSLLGCTATSGYSFTA